MNKTNSTGTNTELYGTPHMSHQPAAYILRFAEQIRLKSPVNGIDDAKTELQSL
jgi:hypothetical protein